jgi:DNA mismatch endonuclease (patch repair protein)
MADTHDKATRSYNMSQIKNKNTKPEVLVRKFLFSKGFRYRLHDKKLPGKPDVVLPKYKTVLFINGCFWHAHQNCKFHVLPKSNKEYWLAKIQRNIQRDVVNHEKLTEMGWKVIIIWECCLKQTIIEDTLGKLLIELTTS